jgi:hypothetical protein
MGTVIDTILISIRLVQAPLNTAFAYSNAIKHCSSLIAANISKARRRPIALRLLQSRLLLLSLSLQLLCACRP